MNTVERIKETCKSKKIPIYKLEKDLGYSNGYIGGLKKGTVPDDRLREIANYLEVSHDYLMYGEETTKKVPTYSRDHIEMIRMYDSCDAASKKKIMDMIRLFSGVGSVVVEDRHITYSVDDPEENSNTKSETNSNK